MMETIYIKRLLKLMRHLRTGKLSQMFSFSFFSNSGEAECGTAGCAIGECPTLWKSWHWINNGTPVLRGEKFPGSSGMKWFGITYNEFAHLFHPYEQRPDLFGGQSLSASATKEEVASNMEAFIKLKEAS